MAVYHLGRKGLRLLYKLHQNTSNYSRYPYRRLARFRLITSAFYDFVVHFLKPITIIIQFH